MTTITMREFQTTLPETIHRLLPGEAMQITENGRPVALVTAVAGTRPVPKLGTQRGSVLSMEHFDDPLEEFAEYS